MALNLIRSLSHNDSFKLFSFNNQNRRKLNQRNKSIKPKQLILQNTVNCRRFDPCCDIVVENADAAVATDLSDLHLLLNA